MFDFYLNTFSEGKKIRTKSFIGYIIFSRLRIELLDENQILYIFF